PPSDPAHAQLAEELASVDEQLTANFHYTTASAPQPGTLFIDPQFQSKVLEKGPVSSEQFPSGTPVFSPPSPMDALFANGRPVQTRDASGEVVTLNTPDEYCAFLKQNRVQSGMPR